MAAPEKENVINDSDRSAEDSSGAGACCSAGDYVPSFGIIFAKKYSLAISICLIILSIGLACAAILFVYLCFRYPSSANIILPVFVGLLGGTAIKYSKGAAQTLSDRLRANKEPNTK